MFPTKKKLFPIILFLVGITNVVSQINLRSIENFALYTHPQELYRMSVFQISLVILAQVKVP